MQNKFELLSVIYFQNKVYCGMRFLVVQISALPCILNHVGIAVLSVECNAMKEWKLSIFNIVAKHIKFYSQNTNRVSKNFIGCIFWFQQTRLQTTLLLFVAYTTFTL